MELLLELKVQCCLACLFMHAGLAVFVVIEPWQGTPLWQALQQLLLLLMDCAGGVCDTVCV